MKEKILHEIPEKRDRYTKHFQTGHKECVAAVYPYPVHYEEEGQWKEIDNRLELKTENGKEYYGNCASALQVRFAKDAGEDHLVILKKEGHKLGWDLEGKQLKDAEAVDSDLDIIQKEQKTEEKKTEVQKTDKGRKKGFRVKEKEPPSLQMKDKDTFIFKGKDLRVSDLVSEGVFEDILPDTDLAYVIDGERLKENITLKSRSAADGRFIFRLVHKGLTLKALKDGSGGYGLFEKEKEEAEFYFQTPYMYDAEGSVSMDVQLTAEEGTDASRLEILPDKEWLLSKERVYPVVIDPMVETTKDKQNVVDAFVKMRDADATDEYHYFRVGYESSQYGACRGFLKFMNLPSIGPGAIVTKAYMRIYQYGYDYWNQDAKIPVTAHAVNGPWDHETITWNTQPSVSLDEALDVKEIGYVASGSAVPIHFDVTKLVRNWYNTGENHGICLKTVQETDTTNDQKCCGKFFAADYPLTGAQYAITEEQYPCGIIEYRNVTGLEEYQSYHSQDLGYSGTGHTNDYTGNVVWIFTDIATAGGILPVILKHIYNLSERNVKTPVGYGWRLNVMQELKESGIEDYPYVYTDGDGTKHYFYKDKDDNDKLKDEDGLGLTITQTEAEDTEAYRIMETKDKMVYTFASDGYLRRIADPDGNCQEFTYGWPFSGGPKRIVKARDGSNKELYFYYESTNTDLVKVCDKEDASGRNILYEYDDNGQLLYVTLPDGKKNKYYCDAEYKLLSLRNHDDRKITYEYVSDFSVPRVSRVYQTGNDSDDTGAGGTIGRDMTIAYENGNTTIFTECALNGSMEETADRRIYTYHFDDMGRPVDVIRDDGRAASWAYFTASGDSNSAKHNKLTKEGRCQPTIKNYLRNPAFSADTLLQTGDYWSYHKVPSTAGGGVTRCVNGHPAGAAPGADFWKEAGLDYIDITKGTDTELLGLTQQVALPAGTYTFSAYGSVRWTDKTGEGKGAGLFILDAEGTVIAMSSLLTELSDSAFSHGWERLTVTFTLDTAQTVRVLAGGCGSCGLRLYFTGFQLEEGSLAHRNSLVYNGSFDILHASAPVAWTYEADDSSARYVDDTEKGTCAYLKGEYDKKKRLYQRFNCYGDEDDVYSLSGWAKGAGVPDGEFKITAKVIYEDGSEKSHDFSFNRNVTNWQFLNGMFRTGDDNEGSGKRYKAIEVSLVFDDQCNEARFTGIQLIRDEGESYVYDDNGNLTGARSAKNAGSFQHDASDNLRRMTDISGSAFEYAYDEKKHVVSAKNSQGVQYSFGYSTKGQPVKTAVQGGRSKKAVSDEGIYYIRERVSGNYLQPSAATAGSGAVLMPFDGTDLQKWQMKKSGDGQYQIMCQGAQGLCLELKDGSDTDKAAVQVASAAAADAQKWELHPMGNGTYQVSCKATKNKKGLTNVGHGKESGHAVQNYTLHDDYINQQWYLESIVSGRTYSDAPENGTICAIRVRHSSQYITPSGISEGSLCKTAHGDGSEKQMFLLEEVSGKTGYYYLHSIHAGDSGTDRVLAKNSSGQLCLKAKVDGDASMQFTFTQGTSGQTYYLVCASGNLAATVPGSTYDTGTTVTLTSGASGLNKQWILEDLGRRIVSSVTYDEYGKVTKVTDSRGNSSENTYDSDGRLLMSITDAKGAVTSYTYDGLDRITKVTHKASATGADGASVSYTYAHGDLKSIVHNGFQYRFGFNAFRNVNLIKAANADNSESQTLMKKTFFAANGPLKTQTYGDGCRIRYTYDKDEQVTGVYKRPAGSDTETRAVTNTYDKNKDLVLHKDHENGILTSYSYDFTGHLTARKQSGVSSSDTAGYLSRTIGYDDKDRVSSHIQKLGSGTAVRSSYLYGDASLGEEPGLTYGLAIDGTQRERLTYDTLGRIVKKEILTDDETWTTEYTYVKGKSSAAGSTTLLVESVKDNEKTLFYTYDETGNIIKIEETEAGSTLKEEKASYAYDSLGQLIRENNKWTNETVVYAYDAGGNMTSRDVYSYTTGTPSVKKTGMCAAFTYGNYWKDQLTDFRYTDGAQQKIEYTDGGNPHTYRNLAMTWKDGRKLSQVKSGENVIASYVYDQNGDRIRKTVGSAVSRFHTDGGKILIMEKDGKEIHFLYDQEGNLFGMKVMSGTSVTDYYYEKNLQGDVTGLIDKNGTKVVSYTYDSWGRPVSMTDNSGTGIGSLNPFRYRGYFYDEETGWYYLKSRYYDPDSGRFINADTVDILLFEFENLLQHNLYIYANNNPIRNIDSFGYVPQAVEDGRVHKWVLEEICKSNTDLVCKGTCIYYNGKDQKNGWGFCDLYNKETGEVWELKKVSDTRSCTTAAAQAQLEKYVNGRLRSDLTLTLQRPITTIISSGHFSKIRLGIIYNISYYNEGNGILRYEYNKKKTENRRQAEAALNTVVKVGIVSIAVSGVIGPIGGLVVI